MKTLTLLRHAKSTWDDPIARDFDRPLNQRGRRAATAMGREMRELELKYDLVMASPAVRVIQTIDALASGYGTLSPDYDKRIYLGSAATLTELLLDIKDSKNSVLLVGHNPGLEHLALSLTEDGDPLRSAIEEKYPTAALAEIALPLARWGDLVPGIGKIQRFIRPRDIDPALGPDEDTI